MNSKVQKLISAYSAIFANKGNRPTWATKKIKSNEIIHPSIPFVGCNYNKTEMLVYASAENLSSYKGSLDKDNEAINRHREHFNGNLESFFPTVHIAPIDSGALVNIVAYLSKKIIPGFEFNSPRELLEGIAFGNFGKFSISVPDRKYIDYANNYAKLAKSIEYIKADLNILKPNILILPKTIFNHSPIKIMLKNEFPKITVIPIYQISHFTINKRNILGMYNMKDKNKLGILDDWQNKFGRVPGKNNNFYRYYTYLDELIEDVEF